MKKIHGFVPAQKHSVLSDIYVLEMCVDASEREAVVSGDPVGWVRTPAGLAKHIDRLVLSGLIDRGVDGFVCPSRTGREKIKTMRKTCVN